MNERKNRMLLIGFALSLSLFAATLTAALLTAYYHQTLFSVLDRVCREITEIQPDAAQAVAAALKECKYQSQLPSDAALLPAYGYRPSDFFPITKTACLAFAAAGFLPGALLFLFTLRYRRKKETARIDALTDYLEKVNTGGTDLLPDAREDAFSRLQDEIYKTVTMLYQTRDAALTARNNFAENLSNIAHQLKTPITSISLSTQLLEKNPSPECPKQIRRQLSRLTHLEEALLLLSRIDAGTLSLEKKKVDVFTVLMLAADNLEEVCREAEVSLDIPESGEMLIYADLDWTMEALMNLLKNCVEHTPPGETVHCRYTQNPLYTQIRIWDTGAGFAKEDLPHIFERFYRGQNAKDGGIGIGLPLSRAIIENQNGTLTAQNLVNGGACFEIRLYRH